MHILRGVAQTTNRDLQTGISEPRRNRVKVAYFVDALDPSNRRA